MFTRAIAPLRVVSHTTLPASRTFAASAVSSKSLVDTVKETADAVNKKVGETLASGIDTAKKATTDAKKAAVDTERDLKKHVDGASHDASAVADKAKIEAHGTASDLGAQASKAGDKAARAAEGLKQEANHALGSAAGAARDVKDEVKKHM